MKAIYIAQLTYMSPTYALYIHLEEVREQVSQSDRNRETQGTRLQQFRAGDNNPYMFLPLPNLEHESAPLVLASNV
jgi:hypothetical protein